MSPLRLSLEGTFWDSQIYEGRLYLFDRGGSLLTLHWDKLLANTLGALAEDIAIECGFRRGDYLYGQQWNIFFRDAGIKEVITKRFAAMARRRLHIKKSEWSKFVIREQDNPFPFPHSDSAIHYRTMIVAGSEGLWTAGASKKNVYPIARKSTRQWDCPVYSVAAGFRKVALAAGDEGLWETPFGDGRLIYDTYDDVSQLSVRRSDKCNWMYGDLYGSSYSSGGFLAEVSDFYRQERADTTLFGENSDEEAKERREVEATVIFKKSGFSWGVRDKIYLHDGRNIHVSSYAPWTRDDSPFSTPVHFALPELVGPMVTGSAAPFGSLVEFEDRLVVILSDGTVVTLEGEPINWRVFPNAKFYQNQLHVVYEGELVVYSFNQDYFVDPKGKSFGIKPIYDRPGGRRSPTDRVTQQ